MAEKRLTAFDVADGWLLINELCKLKLAKHPIKVFVRPLRHTTHKS